MKVTIRDVAVACSAASVVGSADLRDLALEVASRIAPERAAHVAAALILVAVGEDPAAHGVPISTEMLGHADRVREELLRAQMPADVRVERAEADASERIEKASRARDEAEARASSLAAEVERLSSENATLRAEIERLSSAADGPSPSEAVSDGKPRKK